MNAATGRNQEGGSWSALNSDQLVIPAVVSEPAGACAVQVQRTFLGGVHDKEAATSRGSALPLAGGERSVLAQYFAAIRAAKGTIYIENQYLAEETVIVELAAACERGVSVIAVVPTEQDGPSTQAVREARSALGQKATFVLAALVSTTAEGVERPIYVHDKVMIVDDVWATVGSANLHRPSLYGNAEINVSVWNADFARDLRVDLFREHLGVDTTTLSDRDAFNVFLAALDARDAPGGSHVVRLDPSAY